MKRKKFLIFILWVLVFFWMGFIYYLSNMNTNESNLKSKNAIVGVIDKTIDTTNKFGITHKESSLENNELVTNKLNVLFRKVAHASVYFVFSILLFCSIKISFGSYFYRNRFIYLIVIFFSFLYACSDEYHQTFVFGRNGQFTDVLIDVMGAIVGVFVFYLFFLKYKKSS